MARTLLCSFAGAAFGFLVAVVLVGIASGGERGSDTAAVTVLFGGFLAAAGAIVGALIGGVADLLAYFRRRDEAIRDAQAQRESKSGV